MFIMSFDDDSQSNRVRHETARRIPRIESRPRREAVVTMPKKHKLVTLRQERPNETAARTTLKLVVLAGATLHRSRSSATWRSPYSLSLLPPLPPPRASDSLPCRRWHFHPTIQSPTPYLFSIRRRAHRYIQRAARCHILPVNDDAVTIRRDLRRKLRAREGERDESESIVVYPSQH